MEVDAVREISVSGICKMMSSVSRVSRVSRVSSVSSMSRWVADSGCVCVCVCTYKLHRADSGSTLKPLNL